MNVKRLHLFQVYVVYEGQEHRFHMQRRDEGDFYITDPQKVPQPFLALEKDLSYAIFEQSKNNSDSLGDQTAGSGNG